MKFRTSWTSTAYWQWKFARPSILSRTFAWGRWLMMKQWNNNGLRNKEFIRLHAEGIKGNVYAGQSSEISLITQINSLNLLNIPQRPVKHLGLLLCTRWSQDGTISTFRVAWFAFCLMVICSSKPDFISLFDHSNYVFLASKPARWKENTLFDFMFLVNNSFA